MKVIYDLADRYQVLAAMEADALVVNEDGTQVNAYVEIACECYECVRHEVTIEMRDHMIRITRAAMEKALLKDSFAFKYGTPPWKKEDQKK